MVEAKRITITACLLWAIILSLISCGKDKENNKSTQPITASSPTGTSAPAPSNPANPGIDRDQLDQDCRYRYGTVVESDGAAYCKYALVNYNYSYCDFSVTLFGNNSVSWRWITMVQKDDQISVTTNDDRFKAVVVSGAQNGAERSVGKAASFSADMDGWLYLGYQRSGFDSACINSVKVYRCEDFQGNKFICN